MKKVSNFKKIEKKINQVINNLPSLKAEKAKLVIKTNKERQNRFFRRVDN